MELQILIIIILGALLFWIFLKITKVVLKAISLAFLILLLVVGITGFLVYKDIKDFRENIGEKPLLFVLTSENEVLAAVNMDGINEDDDDFYGRIALQTAQIDLQNMASFYKNKDFNSMLGDSYKIIFSDIKFIKNGLPDDFIVLDKKNAGKDITKEEVVYILKGLWPLEIPSKLEKYSPEAVKNIYFMESLSAIIEEKGFSYLYTGLNNKDLGVYKEPITLKLIIRP